METPLKKVIFDVLKVPLVLLILWFLVWAIIFQNTLSSVYSVWMGSNTYAHGIFVIPVVLYFIYDRWPQVLAAKPKPSYITIIPMLLLQGLWLLGYAADVELFKHAAVFGMLSCSIVMFLGWNISRILWFPLVFMVFAIPAGEELVPAFQVITADISVQLLRWTGVPVYRDGLFISIPEGMFEVAEACSGIRFFVACVVMGSIISYVSYSTLWKRLAFFSFSIVLPIFANSVRVYGTILVGHFIDMKYASEADHLVYGWGFFAFVVLVLVVCSKLGAEETGSKIEKNDTASGVATLINDAWLHQRWGVIALLAVLPLAITLIVHQSSAKEKASITLDTSNQPGKTVYSREGSAWMPIFTNPTVVHFGQAIDEFDYFLAGYALSKPGTELVSDHNHLFNVSKWRQISSESLQLKNSSHEVFRVNLLHVGAANGQKRLIAYWYYLPNLSSSNRLKVKLVQAVSVLGRKGAAGAVIALSIPYAHDLDLAKVQLTSIVTKNSIALENMVRFD